MVITEWTGAHVKPMRAALRDTQQQFAERLGVSVAVVGKWETRGATITLWPKFAAMMDTTYARLEPAQRQLFIAALADGPIIARAADVGRGSDVAGEAEDNVNRRESFGAMLGLTMLAIGEPTMPGKELARIGVTDAQQVQTETDRLEREDQHVGSGALLSQAYRKLDVAKILLETGEFTSASGPAFMSATGNLAVLVGWLAYDSENHPLARRCYGDALSMAALAGDDELIAHASLYAALQSNRLARQGAGSAQYSLRLTERARNLTHGLPSGRIHALVEVREASAYAILGDRAAFGRHLASAQREMDRAAEYEPLAECPTWLRFMSHAELRFQEAKGHEDLGHGADAIGFYADAIDWESGTRNAVSYRASMAAAHVGIGNTRTAVAEGVAVLDQLEGNVSSGRTVRTLAPVRHAVHDSGHSAAVDFRHRYDALALQAR